MTVIEAIQRGTEFLGRKGLDSPRLQVELLLAHVLHLPRMQLYLQFERALSGPELTSMRELIRRRGQREPLQYLIGSVSFCGLELEVSPQVLIPRPETELLAERAWQFLSALAETDPSRVLDVGTGSGCLAVLLAVKCARAHVEAVDLSEAALELAARNAQRHGVSGRIHFVRSDGFSNLNSGLSFDLIVSNPPYIATGEIPMLQPEVRDHEPAAALDGGPDGLRWFRRLAAEAGVFLKSSGRMMLEFGDGQAGAVREILEGENWIVEAMIEDYTQRPRIAVMKRTS